MDRAGRARARRTQALIRGQGLDAVLKAFQADPELSSRVVHRVGLPPRPGRRVPFPPWVPQPVRNALARQGIKDLWSHQAEAAGLLWEGKHTVVATGTASGKSLAYYLPVLSHLARDPGSTALFLYPTKALARDQARFLFSLALPFARAGTYDGDTPSAERPWIRRNANIVLSNPDMLHTSILPGHDRWARFFARLAYVVLDEVHAARGVFGSHVGLVLRRLQRICSHYGSRPTFAFASATIGNPGELASRLLREEVVEVTEDGSPQGERIFLFLNPPLIDEARGLRKNAATEAAGLMAELVERGVKTLSFARTRRSAELLAMAARKRLAETFAHLEPPVAAYRAGYLPEERRELEAAFASGHLLGLAATTALELGIDIGDLDAVVLAGYPGTLASLWQQAGRAGRKGGKALVVMVAQDDPLDQYVVENAPTLLTRPQEAAVVDPENPHLLRDHLVCAAEELPLDPRELPLLGREAPALASALKEEGLLREFRGRLFYSGPRGAARRVNLRSVAGQPVLIVEAESGSLLGTVDAARALWTVHPGAVYLHQGEEFVVEELDLERGIARVRESGLGYYTVARDVSDVEVLTVEREGKVGKARLYLGRVKVTNRVVGYEKRATTGEPLGVEPLYGLPEQHLETEALWFTLEPRLIEAAGLTPWRVPGTVHAAEHTAIGLFPVVVMADRWDVGGLSTPLHKNTGLPTVFIYDGYPGGAGISARAFASAETLLQATHERVRSCPCKQGCPSCVYSPKCGNGNEPLDKEGAAALLASLLQ